MAVRKVEMEAEKYSFARYTTSSTKKKMEMSRRVRLQGILYSAALASMCLGIFLVTMQMPDRRSYVVDVLFSILSPLQGFWNVMIYKKPLLEQITKKVCKSSQQNISGSSQDYQNTSKGSSWLTSLSKFWIQKRTSKKSKGTSSNNKQVEDKDESKKGEDLEEGTKDRVGILKVNSKQKEQILPVNASSELKSGKVVMFKEIKGEDSNAVTSSTLMLSCVEQEEADEPLSFGLSQRNSELEKGDQSQLEYFSALEVNTDGCDNVNDEDNDSDNETYVDDYLKMMEIGW